MPAQSKASSASRIAIIYITIGALMLVWSAVWYLWLNELRPEERSSYFWCFGVMLSGLTLVVIGLGVGRIGRAAADADLSPEQATATPPKPDQHRLPAAAPGAVPVQVVPVPPGTPVAPVVGAHPALGATPVGVNQAAPPARKA